MARRAANVVLRALFLSMGVVGCAPPAPAKLPPSAFYPSARADGSGYTLRMTSSVEPGQEIERCRFFVVPPEGIYLKNEEVHYTPGSHHVLLFTTPYTSVPTKDTSGVEHDTSGVFDCTDTPVGQWSVSGIAGGAQSANTVSAIDLPDGVALKLAPGSVLIMNTHYLNASGARLDTEATMDIYTRPAADVRTEAGVIFYYDLFIRVPPLASARARMRCPISRDVTLLNAQSHMHRRGVGYEADLVDKDARLIEVLYQNSNWQDVPIKAWSPGKPLPTGTQIDYHCDYVNTEDRTVLQGFTTRDEMCMFIGVYYPRDPVMELCSLDGTINTDDLNATWVGSGATGCADTMTCLLNAPGGDGDKSDNACLQASCAGAATVINAFLRCKWSHGHDACTAVCQKPSAACSDCLVTHCPDEVSACRAAQCGAG